MKSHQSKRSLEELFLKLSPAGRRAFFDRCLADDFLAAGL
jgi:hypothetical protein